MKTDITLLTCTHGRPFFLTETVECFRRQIIPMGISAEMLIYNDCPEQHLVCNVPGVRIVNLEKTFDDVSEKWNRAFEDARGEWVAPLDDDDISLPFRLSYSIIMANSFPNIMAFRHTRAWYMNGQTIFGRPGNLFFGSAFINREYYLVHGRAESRAPTDASSWAKMLAAGQARAIEPSPEETHFIYRWGGMAFHWSGAMDGKKTMRELNDLYLAKTRADPRWQTGTIEIVPGWKTDYCDIVSDAIMMENIHGR